MKLYDFGIYARRRDERKAAEAVAGAVANIHQPGSVVELKVRVNHWFELHLDVLRQANSS